LAGLRIVATTVWPARATPMAAALPNPELQPVINTTDMGPPDLAARHILAQTRASGTP
jgi:hypothetical protein